MVFNPKLDWKDDESGGTPVTAAQLIRIETGIKDGDLTNQSSAASVRAGQIFEPIGLSDTTKTYVNDTIVAATVGKAEVTDLPLNAKALGAIGDGATDDYAALQAILDTLDTRSPRGGSLYLPTGVYAISQPLESGQYTIVYGDGKNSSTIIAGTGFPGGSPLLRMGKTGVDGAIFGCRVQDLTLDCNDVASGLFTERWNEQSGGRNLSIRRAIGKGLHVGKASTGQIAAGYTLDNCEISMSLTNSSACIGLHIESGARHISDVTANSFDGSTQLPAGSIGFLLDAQTGLVTNLHPEHFSVGVQVGQNSACSGIVLINIGGHSSVAKLLQITSGLGTSAFTLLGIRALGSTTILDDQVNSITATDSFISHHFSGSGLTGSQFFITSIPSVTSRFPAGISVLGSFAHMERAASSNRVFESKVTTYTNNSWQMTAGGLMEWGPGTGDTVSVSLGFRAKNSLAVGDDDTFSTGRGLTAARPAASVVGVGAQWFDTTLGKPIWSNGTGWVDASGATV